MDVAVILTPFQLRQLTLVRDQYGWDLSSALFASVDWIGKKAIEDALGHQVKQHVSIPKHRISLPAMMRAPFFEIPRHRKEITHLDAFVSDTLSIVQGSIRLLIGSDKDIFTQLLIKQSEKEGRLEKVCALDEGLGYYKTEGNKDRFLRWGYKWFSKMLFTKRIAYVGTLARIAQIDEVYARFPESIPYKSDKIAYFKILPAQLKNPRTLGADYLLLTSPLSEDAHADEEVERAWLSTVLGAFPNGAHIVIKPHPRERVEKYSRFLSDAIQLMESKFSAEEMDYFCYRKIVHFGSSVILDIYQSGYPMENVVTIDMGYAQAPITQRLFDRGEHVQLRSPNLKLQLDQILQNE